MSAGAENVIVFPRRNEDSGEDDSPLVEPGLYVVTYESHHCAVVFQNKAPKLCVRMRLAAHPAIILERWYRVTDFRRGRIVANRSSDIFRELRDVLGRGVRRDRIAPAMLKGIYVRAEVRTVVRNYEQQEVSENNRYSVIGKLIARVEP